MKICSLICKKFQNKNHKPDGTTYECTKIGKHRNKKS